MTKPRLSKELVVVCGDCGRTEAQHGLFSCAELDAIGARIEFGRREWWRRIIARRPKGWRQ